jgi:hypothetical protein
LSFAGGVAHSSGFAIDVIEDAGSARRAPWRSGVIPFDELALRTASRLARADCRRPARPGIAIDMPTSQLRK